MTIRILGKTASINVRKVLWTCAELGLAHEQEEWGAGVRATQVPEFLALNPNAMVPVIVDGDFVLWESNTICRYLAGRERRHDLLPADAKVRARVEQWMDWQATEFNNSWRYAFLGLVRKHPDHQDPAQLAAGVLQWTRHVRLLEDQLQRTGAYAAGDAFTLADIVLGLSVHRWLAAPIERPELPAVQAYHARLCARAGVMEFMAP
ncbi:glutathione S-transferase family protein [Burkholderiaceae bacterium UC74_6]